MMDKIKLFSASLLVLAAVGGFYYFGDESTLLRVVVLLIVVGVSTTIILQTSVGRTAWAFLGDANTEIRKVVWPTRRETMQTTLIVFVMVVIVALFLWGLDSLLLLTVKLFTGQGG